MLAEGSGAGLAPLLDDASAEPGIEGRAKMSSIAADIWSMGFQLRLEVEGRRIRIILLRIDKGNGEL